ncbi:MAG: hypothetical protein ACRCUJ_03020 [Phocaeicola sp.]
MTRNNFLISTLFTTTLLVAGCSDLDVHHDSLPPLLEDKELRAIVVNEGQFGYGTSSLTTLTHADEVEQDLFRRVNNRPMGDVAQSITRIGNYYYVPLNNSKKVEVFQVGTYQSVETMSIDKNNLIPMYITHLGGDSIFVTNQNSKGEVLIMDINHGKERSVVRRSFKIGGGSYRTFQSRLLNNKLFVGGDGLWMFDLNNLSAESHRNLYYQSEKDSDGNPRRVQTVDFSKLPVDKHNRIWALTWFIDSNTYKDRSYLLCIDPQTEKTLHEIDVTSLGINTWIGCIDISPDGSTIYFNSSRNVYTLDVENPQLPSKPTFAIDLDETNEADAKRKRKTVYHMSISKENTLFMVEVLYGSIERSDVYEYDPRSGALLQKFEAGIFAHHIYYN